MSLVILDLFRARKIKLCQFLVKQLRGNQPDTLSLALSILVLIVTGMARLVETSFPETALLPVSVQYLQRQSISLPDLTASLY